MSAKKTMERGSGIALWRQVAEELRLGIQGGLVREDGLLPGEIALAERYGVNRHTVRSAIKALADEGLVEARQGMGTYVIEQARITYPIGRKTRFSDGIGSQARIKKGKLLSAVEEPANRELAAALGLSIRARLLRLETLSYADEKPMAITSAWFDAAQFSGIDQFYAKTGSITRSLAEYGISDYYRARTEIEARHTGEYEAKMLELPMNSILLVTRAVNADSEGTPIQYSTTRFAADRITLTMTTEVAYPPERSNYETA